MKHTLAEVALDQLFREARSYNRWLPDAISEQTLRCLYSLVKFGPTSFNCCPARFVFVTSPSAKAKLVHCVASGNAVKVEQAPVTVIIGMDTKFDEKISLLNPQSSRAVNLFKDPAFAQITMVRNSSLQGAYLIIAARALGLDCGPMSGFDHAKVDSTFFAGTAFASNFICALGTGTREKLSPRGPRLTFDDACRII